ncbi:Aste57867_435 [Aphanomyces stellatus]|uniref:Aste57867_435 protein n=1 Tax=Aphanomyces stellatus TaxID=120398 RepID=A0A485K2S6_9STRA|nr:hypothetical protein As57867_000434 [Aphanomyces stellatus]VFT77660.1 Aste57867_435 [Aphanomyces stellatus]
MENKRRTASDTSSIQSPTPGISAHVVERNLSSASALSTPRSNIGSTLNVCVEGKFLGILMSGMVDKRREGAVRAGFARRLFLLSVRGCHYYRKADENEVFGTERGHLSLRDFGYAKIVPEGEAPYGTVESGVEGTFIGLFSKQHTLTWFLRVETFDLAKQWVTSILAAQEVAKKHLYPNEWTPEMFAQYTSMITGTPLPPSLSPKEPPRQTTPKANKSIEVEIPSILAVSIAADDCRERLVSRRVDLHKDIPLGLLTLQETFVFLLTNQEVLTLKPPLSALGKPVVLKHTKGSVQTLVTVVLQGSKATARPAPSSEELVLPAPYNAAALGFSALYVLSCLLAYLFGPAFQGIMQVTVIMGFLLSASVLASALSRRHSDPTPKAVESPTVLYNVTLKVTKVDAVRVDEAPAAAAAAVDAGAAPTPTAATPYVRPPVTEMAFSLRFIAAEKGDEEKGRARFEKTLKWRRDNNVDGIMYEPQHHFHLIKKYYPQFFHGKSIKGHCVYYEKVGKIDLKALKAAGLTMDQLLRHYVYLTEYQWIKLEPSDTGRSVTVLDIEGIGFYDLTGDVMDFVRQAMGFVSAHYPERSAQIFIINVPSWFSMTWKVISPMIDPVTKEKIRICKGKAVKEELLKSIAESDLPSDYGGLSVALGQSDQEVALAKHVDDIIAASSQH